MNFSVVSANRSDIETNQTKISKNNFFIDRVIATSDRPTTDVKK